jgi:oligoribonuclease (3'-5' exoribonuclease)
MPTLTPINTVYTHPVAKVMISIPDEVLGRLDAYLSKTGETRSGFLRRVAEADIDAAEAARRKHFEDLLEKATAPMGGNAAQLIREDRESH